MPKSGEETSKSGRRSLLRLFLAAAVFSAGTIWFLYMAMGPEEAHHLTFDVRERLQSAPPIAFFSVVFVTSFLPIPTALLYVAAGTLYGVTESLLWIAPTAMLSNTVIYFLCSSFLRPVLISEIERRGHAIPRIRSKSDETLLIALVRITPGIPYFFQNWLLGLSGVSLFPSLTITLVIHMAYASGFVILGRSAFEGELGMVVFGVALLVSISIVARIVHRRLQMARAKSAESNNPNLDERMC